VGNGQWGSFWQAMGSGSTQGSFWQVMDSRSCSSGRRAAALCRDRPGGQLPPAARCALLAWQRQGAQRMSRCILASSRNQYYLIFQNYFQMLILQWISGQCYFLQKRQNRLPDLFLPLRPRSHGFNACALLVLTSNTVKQGRLIHANIREIKFSNIAF